MTVSFDIAAAFVAKHHRHHTPPAGHKFSLGCEKAGALVGVAIVGRPVARMRDDGETLEVTRLCTDGTKDACSFLYGAAARAALALGYRRIGTYILKSEPGTSLKAAGWKCLGERGGGSWTRDPKPHWKHKVSGRDGHPLEQKMLFEMEWSAP